MITHTNIKTAAAINVYDTVIYENSKGQDQQYVRYNHVKDGQNFGPLRQMAADKFAKTFAAI